LTRRSLGGHEHGNNRLVVTLLVKILQVKRIVMNLVD